MKKNIIVILTIVSIFFSTQVIFAQDKAIYRTIHKDGKPTEKFSLDISKLKKPESIDDFKTWGHLPPISQGKTGTCWCFATISFLESELIRIGKGEIKLSEIYIAYWEFVEKARRFVQEKGDSYFAQGSEHNAVLERMKQYGLVPASEYSGLINGQENHNHNKMSKEIKKYLEYLKENEIWDENEAVEYTKLVLNKYLGKPPENFVIDSKTITPLEYMKNNLELNPDDYVLLISMMYAPFYEKAVFKVPDNWWLSDDYYNVPLKEFYQGIVTAVKNGFTVGLGGDTSEIGKYPEEDVAFIPSFDIPSKYINQSAREFRYKNKTSTDDHAIHLLGYKKLGKHTWFLIKDSGRSSRKGNFKGYYMFRDDYIKLKILNIIVHKDAIPKLMKKL